MLRKQFPLENEESQCEDLLRPRSKIRNALCYVLIIVFSIIFSIVFVRYIGQRAVVHQSSMYPTLIEGQSVYVDKLLYKYKGIQRFDIIVCDSEVDGGKLLIKRVIALPGETIHIDSDGVIYINDEVLQDDYGNEKMVYAGSASEKITLADDEYFVLGDNRNNSTDSRFQILGNVKEADIIGKLLVNR